VRTQKKPAALLAKLRKQQIVGGLELGRGIRNWPIAS